jgi:tetratricopeptide (TPR) repeat protein
VGETLALPVRLLGHAAPGEVLVSAPIARLTQEWVEVNACPLPSGNEPAAQLLAYRVGGPLPPRPLLTGLATQAPRPLLGRAHELTALHEMLTQVEVGWGQVVGIVGEPGMGKSRHLTEWRQSLTAQEVTYLEGHCWSYGSATPYQPILDLLRAHCGITPDDSAGSITAKVRELLQGAGMTPDEWAPYLLRLLEIQAGTEGLVGISPETLKAKTFEAMRLMWLHHSQQHPLILAVEDLHWIDPTSEEFLARLVDSIAGAPILVLATYRPGYRPSWLGKSYATQVTLQPLSSQESLQIIRTVLQTETVPDPLVQAIFAKAQGNPFFLEEIAQTLVEQSSPGHERGEALPSDIQLPTTLQGVLAARINRLPAEPKALLQVAAVIGKACTHELLQRVVDLPDTAFWQQLSQLQRAEFLYEQPTSPSPVYAFKHALIQEVAYTFLPQARKQAVHERTAQAIEVLAGERLTEHYSELAHHYSHSDNTQQAVAYLQRAGQQAADRSAYGEAITHLARGLELLPSLPESPARTRYELDLQIALGWALIATKGQAAPEVEQAFTRARASLDQAMALDAPTRDRSPAIRLSDHIQGVSIQGVSIRRHAAWTLWYLGYPEQARQRSHEAITLAQELAHPFSLAYALYHATELHCLRREAQAAEALAEAMIVLARQHEFPGMVARGTVLRGWALAAQGQSTEGIAQIRQGMDALGTMGGEAAQHRYRLALLAEAYAWIGQTAKALGLLDEALALTRHYGGHFYEAEVYRLTGEILLMQDTGGGMSERTPPELPMVDKHQSETTNPSPGHTQAETWFRQALDIARRQQAKSLELRAAMSLSRLWQGQGKYTDAYRLLAPICGWFTEGFDTADLQDAKALLEALA